MKGASYMEQESAILGLFDKVEQDKSNSQKMNSLLRKFGERREKFEELLTEQQKEDLQSIIEITYDMRVLENQEYFKEGFSIATRLITEAFYNQSNEGISE